MTTLGVFNQTFLGPGGTTSGISLRRLGLPWSLASKHDPEPGSTAGGLRINSDDFTTDLLLFCRIALRYVVFKGRVLAGARCPKVETPPLQSQSSLIFNKICLQMAIKLSDAG